MGRRHAFVFMEGPWSGHLRSTGDSLASNLGSIMANYSHHDGPKVNLDDWWPLTLTPEFRLRQELVGYEEYCAVWCWGRIVAILVRTPDGLSCDLSLSPTI